MNRARLAPGLRPIGDLAREYFYDGLPREAADRILLVDQNRDAIQT